MTKTHDHDHHHDHGTEERGAHGVTPPPPDATLQEYRARGIRGVEQSQLHFFRGPGPLDVKEVPAKYIRLRDGTYQKCTYEFRWYLDKVAPHIGWGTALQKLYDVLLAPRSWARAGVHWKRTMSRQDADILVRIIPQDTTVCGPGSAGCYSWGYEPDGKPVAEVGSEYIERVGPFAALVNMEMLGHGTFRGDDMYFTVHQPYIGVMGTWQAMAAVGYMPTDQEVADSIEWLKGLTPAERIHRHS